MAVMFGGNTVVKELSVISGRILSCSPVGDMLNGEGSLYGQKE
jgi:hypothetical protein